MLIDDDGNEVHYTHEWVRWNPGMFTEVDGIPTVMSSLFGTPGHYHRMRSDVSEGETTDLHPRGFRRDAGFFQIVEDTTDAFSGAWRYKPTEEVINMHQEDYGVDKYDHTLEF